MEAVAHAARAHGDGVADTYSVEAEANHASFSDTFLHGLGEAEEVHVAGVSLVPYGGNAHLGHGHFIIGKADAVEDGLGSTLRFGFCDSGAVLVELSAAELFLLLGGFGFSYSERRRSANRDGATRKVEGGREDIGLEERRGGRRGGRVRDQGESLHGGGGGSGGGGGGWESCWFSFEV